MSVKRPFPTSFARSLSIKASPFVIWSFDLSCNTTGTFACRADTRAIPVPVSDKLGPCMIGKGRRSATNPFDRLQERQEYECHVRSPLFVGSMLWFNGER